MSKPYPGHRLAKTRLIFETECECGWRSAGHVGKGARAQSIAEWWTHIDRCKRETA